jgi:flagellar hook-associated protein 1 FlgK
MSDVLSISVSGLRAAQTGLTTVSHNVANVNTEGYSRQRIELAAREPQFTGGGYLGRGVTVKGIERLYDDFLTVEIRDTTASLNEFDRVNKLARQCDNLMADPR